MKVRMWYEDPPVIRVDYDIEDEDSYFFKEVPEDVLDRYDKASAEYQAVQRILEWYNNEG